MDIDDILQEFDAGGAVHDASKDIQNLTTAWIAERSAPEIMPFQAALVDRLTERIRQQIELVEMETGNLDPTSNFRLILVQTELERVKYLIRAYLRIRMHKVPHHERAVYLNCLLTARGIEQIDKYSFHILSNASVRSKLAPSEVSYLKSHLALLNNHYLSSFLRNFPEQLRRLDDTAGGISMVEEPDMDSAVFCRVVRNVQNAVVRIPGTDTEFELAKDDVYVVRYSAVREFVVSGDVELI
jgi:GINS complex subunit 4